MNKYHILFLKTIRKVYSALFPKSKQVMRNCILDADIAAKIISKELTSDKSCMIARFGSTELSCLNNYNGVCADSKNSLNFIRGISPPFWWDKSIIDQMKNWSGFFPPNEVMIERFCELMITDMLQVDILGSWLALEDNFNSYFKATKIHLRLLEPFWNENPWTKILEGKKILVVHPFDEIIKSQYEKRELLFSNKNVLPSFASLNVVRAVQSLGEDDPRFEDWFQALNYMKSAIDTYDYDICLIGAGAYGFPLAAHVKRSGKKAVHMGGSLQLLFGIIGKRWEDPNYGVKEWGIEPRSYSDLINQYWIRPGESYKPKNVDQVEGACYW